MRLFKTDVFAPLEFVSAGRFESNAPWRHSQRVIDSFELIVGLKGTVFIQQEEERYALRPGDVLLLLPGRVHQGYAFSEENSSFYWVHFLCPTPFQIFDEPEIPNEMSMLLSNPESHRIHSSIYIPVFSTPSGIERLNILFRQLLHIANSDYSTSLAAGYMTTSLMLELSEQTIAGLRIALSNHRADDLLANLMEWARIHLAEPVSISELADRFQYNPDYLSRYFKRKTGMNLQEYILALKLSKAKDLLAQTRQSVKEVAYEVGFSDEKYFMRLFKKYEKITPTEYRKAYYMTHLNNQ